MTDQKFAPLSIFLDADEDVDTDSEQLGIASDAMLESLNFTMQEYATNFLVEQGS